MLFAVYVRCLGGASGVATQTQTGQTHSYTHSLLAVAADQCQTQSTQTHEPQRSWFRSDEYSNSVREQPIDFTA